MTSDSMREDPYLRTSTVMGAHVCHGRANSALGVRRPLKLAFSPLILVPILAGLALSKCFASDLSAAEMHVRAVRFQRSFPTSLRLLSFTRVPTHG